MTTLVLLLTCLLLLKQINCEKSTTTTTTSTSTSIDVDVVDESDLSSEADLLKSTDQLVFKAKESDLDSTSSSSGEEYATSFDIIDTNEKQLRMKYDMFLDTQNQPTNNNEYKEFDMNSEGKL